MKFGGISLALVAVAVLLGAVVLLMPAPKAPEVAPQIVPQKEAADSSRSGLSTSAGPVPLKTLPSIPAGLAWEDHLDELLSNDTDTVTTVRGLVGAIRGLPVEAQEEYAAHAVNLCEDDQYSLLAGLYLDPNMPREVTEIIFNDALNRPDEIKLPLLANTLGNASHPMAGEAKEVLEMYLDLEPGATPPDGWEQAVKKYLTDQSAQ